MESSYNYPTRLRMPPPVRSLSSMMTPTLLPDILESPLTPEPARSPAPSPSPTLKPTVRSVSVASFLSDGTVEIEGFGFDTTSDAGDDSSLYESSLYESSIYDGQEGSGRRSPSDNLSRRAEKILADAKRKLDLCGQNILRARSSMILSPSTTPSLLEHFDTLHGATSPPPPEHAESVSPSLLSQRYKVSNNGATHFRAASESSVRAVPRTFSPLSTIQDVPDASEIERPQSEMARSNSSMQMQQLRDQMKNLRGKITDLQQQTKSDSIRRRQSVSSLRSTDDTHEVTPTLDEIRQHVRKSPGEDWEHVRKEPEPEPVREKERDMVQEQQQVDGYELDSQRSGTPKAVRHNVTSPFSEPHEEREDAFSYDSYLIGNTIYSSGSSIGSTMFRPISMSSDGSAATVLQPPTAPTLKRRDSFNSISSYATAAEDPRNVAQSPSASTDSSAHTLRTAESEWLSNPPPALPSPRDDGYHSAPQTPRVDNKLNIPIDQPTPSLSESTWYRASMDTVQTYDDYELPPPTSAVGVRTQAVGVSNRDSSMMVVKTKSGADRESAEIELRLDPESRQLMEMVIEGLGKVCSWLETEKREDVKEMLRGRLRDAMKVMEGETLDYEVF